MKKIAVIGAVLDHPEASQSRFNDVLSEFKPIIQGRMGLPFDEYDISVIAITVMGSLDDINTLTGKLGSIPGITVKTSITKKEIDQ
ncbi:MULTISPECIES: TM1266 family iron-only hydrogenase system putative regulator [unclassified Fusibacter]|uniref:TM1266 family iron-only hydrogenase system putative regulator n=1 Tax=unclassified Fusibacter TaxID=2624464 RepID=UPI0010131190|nr:MULTISPECIES: TM1266 family iron-only hydrogenase system putative regulator [unclassified Fusibacter]MCK8060976.1 iron-only hydrogenase system regulator [Fusibacter sp. A2]NPE20570.1 iron-only hydrogenase system regulator [Fusibacter sp. A1]RXV63767.1 iron-only hydrogenase system regulator [Fusibacter sp. A1]